eukprot:CAMPEP_0202099750 /NCGR_PEP_ID=MMETSP0965-20130614/2723_1 /ASSEMBLY_ACC=CAM_ASM_000507 /TAXON_ID=4773 /ORGANISM="Schizochytrium aggregatum, Strain ATCC28209" /LENGTH=47 /DNA_ID= /DNA_START= /DNA_END= /DNA_ORIENTATION=
MHTFVDMHTRTHDGGERGQHAVARHVHTRYAYEVVAYVCQDGDSEKN